MAPEYCLEIRTVQSAAVKTLVEALKELLTDTILEVTDRGIKVVAVDAAHVVMVHLVLRADRFEYFRCSVPQLKLGVNMLNLYKLIKTVGTSDTLTLYVRSDDLNHLGIRIDSAEKNSRSVYKLNLLDLDASNIQVQPTQFDNVIVLRSADLQKLCRDMHNIADHVEIKVVKGEVSFSCAGDICTQETVLGDGCLQNLTNRRVAAAAEEGEDPGGGGGGGGGGEDEMIAAGGRAEGPEDIVQGVFSLRFLCLFSKCSALSSSAELYMTNNFPLIVRYQVASLGEIKLVLAQRQADD